MRLRTRVAFALLAAFVIGLPLLGPEPVGAESSMVAMRDGVRLATDFYLPSEGGPKFPVVFARSVYGRGGGPRDGNVKRFTDAGYAFVIQDTRGRGDSEGKDACFADDGWGERQDGADSVEWILKQSWCDGKIGTWGASALGITQVRLAGATKKVACQSIMVAASSSYGQMVYQGGVFRKSLCEGWLAMQKIPYIVDEWHSHPAFDAFWKLQDAEPRAPEVSAPAVHFGGWWDIFNQGTINNFVTRQYQGGEGAKGNQKLIMGAWVHGPKKHPGDLEMRDSFRYDMAAYETRFYEYWLKGMDNGIMKEPAVQYYTLGDVFDVHAPGNEWRTAQDWPPFPATETAYYVAADKALTTAPSTAAEAKLAFTYDPADPCPTVGGAELLLPPGPFDQQKLSTRPDVLTFATPPLDKPLEITGRVSVRLFVSTDAPDTDFTAKLLDVYPDGKQILMLDNIRRLKFRKGYEKAEPLAANAVDEIVIDLWSISLIFNKGHKIGLQVSSSNYPRFEKNPNTGEDLPGKETRVAHNTVYADAAHPSALLLPVR